MREFFFLGLGFALAGAIWASFFELDRWLARRQTARLNARYLQQRRDGVRP